MQRTWMGWSLLGAMTVAAWSAAGGVSHAQYPGETVVYETVAPGTRTVTLGESYLVKEKPRKTVIKRRPTAVVTRTPPVVRETRFVQPAPVVERRVVQPAPILESRYVQPAPVLERRWVQPAPVVETRTYMPEPVYQTRYLTPYR
ncbi:hypothetical protein TA3x_003721 [Tundrisphaera sp. TA3]|uniref:hypothetical protein n=1 Tax=Tundrisphaera sp. TA3 TaxID=3435775 RepID=UPI003EC12A33